MTPDEIKQAYFEWIKDYTNNEFNINNLPGGINLSLNQLIEVDPFSFNITSEKLSNMSQTFSNDGDMPKFIYKWLDPYKKLRSL